MPARKKPDWPRAPHTVAKHALLQAYLRAWFPILSHGGFDRLIYIDGFAGPGRYDDGEDGSPIIALKAFAAHGATLAAAVEFHFVERDPATVERLRQALKSARDEGLIPTNVTVVPHEGDTFVEAYTKSLKVQLRQPAPAFPLADPFGWTGLPMAILRELLQRRNTEVLVNFMFEEINRFLAHPEQRENFDALFGTGAWRTVEPLAGSEQRHEQRVPNVMIALSKRSVADFRLDFRSAARSRRTSLPRPTRFQHLKTLQSADQEHVKSSTFLHSCSIAAKNVRSEKN